MGVYNRAVIIVGLRRGDIDNFDALVDEDGGLMGGQLTDCSTYYDGWGQDHNVIGITVAQTPDYYNVGLELPTLLEEIETAKLDFQRLTGRAAKVYLSNEGY